MSEIGPPDLSPHPHPKGEWVSKSDVVAYLRCPYAFWLLDTGQIQPWEALGHSGPPTARTESSFDDWGDWVTILKQSIPALRRGFDFERDSLLFRNPDLRILGRPDGLRTERGALFPVIVRKGGAVSRNDELSLAFYWLALAPYQTVEGPEPRGYAIEQFELRKIRLQPKWFEEVVAICEAIREARRRGVNPRICNCAYCCDRPEIVQAAIDAKDLSCIWGIDRRRAVRLEGLGLRSWADLVAGDPHRLGISPRTIAGYHAHVRSYEECRPVIFGEDRLQLRDFLVLDLEYGSHWFTDRRKTDRYDSIIWMIGVCTVRGSRRKYEFLWADSPSEERKNILRLLKLVEDGDQLPVVTWSGKAADLPQLSKALKRLGLRRSLDTLFARHVDLLEFLRSNVRLPIPRFGLKKVGEYFGITRRSRVTEGREADQIYAEYRRPFVMARDGQERRVLRRKKQRRLRRKLQRYSHDDLKSVADIVRRLRELQQREDGVLVSGVRSSRPDGEFSQGGG